MCALNADAVFGRELLGEGLDARGGGGIDVDAFESNSKILGLMAAGQRGTSGCGIVLVLNQLASREFAFELWKFIMGV